MTEYKLKFQEDNDNEVLASFSSGVPQMESLFGNEPLSFKRNKEKQLYADNDVMEYVGKLSSKMRNKNHSLNGVKYVIGVIDKSTKQIQLSETDLYEFEQTVKRPKCEPLDSDEESDDDDLNDDIDLDPKAAYRKQLALKSNLVQAFAPRKKKNALNASINNRVETDTLVGSSHGIDLDLNIKAEELEAQEQEKPSSLSSIPPRNIEAKAVELVYQLHNLISEEDLEALTKPSKVFTKATKKNLQEWRHGTEIYSPFILDQVETLKSLNPTDRNQKARILLYIHYLIILVKASKNELSQSPRIQAEIPETLRFNLFEKFTAKGYKDNGTITYSKGKLEQDRLLSYIIILSLLCNGFSFDYETLFKCLPRATPKHMNDIVKALGLRQSASKKTLTLSLPLLLPSTFKRR